MRSFFKLAGLFLLLACTGLSSAQTMVSGTISTNTVWDAAGSPYVLTNNLTVSGGTSLATLTIEPGVEVKFYPNTTLFIGTANAGVTDGKLDAQGTVANPILFTSYYDGTKPVNLWRSIHFQNMSDDSSILDNCVVEYGTTAFLTTDANPTVQNSTIRNFTDFAVQVQGSASPVIDGNTIEQTKSAVDISFAATGAPQISNNTIDTCTQMGIKVNGANVSPVISGNSFANVNGFLIYVFPNQVGGVSGNSGTSNDPLKSKVYVTGGEVTKDATWQETNLPLLISNNIFVKGAGGSLVTLTINPDVTLSIEEHKGLYIGSTNIQEPAKLMATSVLFTSEQTANRAIPKGFWYALHFDVSADPTSVVDNCTIENSEYGMWNSTSSPTFSNNTVSNILFNGVFIKDAGSPTVSGNTFDTMPTAVFMNNATTGTPTISGNTIENCSQIAIRSESPAAMPVISGNTFNNNANFLVDLYPNQVNNLSGSTGSGNAALYDMLRIKGGEYTVSGSWTESDIPYLVDNNVFVSGADNPTLTIGENAVLKFSANSGLLIGEPVGGDPGKLVASGATFTSRKETPAAGDWNQVSFDSTADASSTVNNCTFSYGLNGVNVLGSSPTISNSTFENIQTNGIYINKNSAPTISGNTFTGLPVAVYCSQKSTAAPTISGNTFDGLSDVAIVTAGSMAMPVITNNTFSNLTKYVASLSPNQVAHMTGSIASNNDPLFNQINVRAGELTQSGTWAETEVGYFISGDLFVAGVGAEATLTLAEGVELYFFRNAGLFVGSATAANSGKLMATQTLFTTFDQNDPDLGEWDFIYLYDNASDETTLNGCIIEYAIDGLELHDASVTVQNSTFQNLMDNGIDVVGDCDVTLNGNTFTSSKSAVVYNLLAVGTLTVDDNTFTGLTGNVLVLRDNAIMTTITNNVFSDNDNYLVQLFPDDAKYVTGNTYTNNRLNEIYVQRGFISEDAVWGEQGVAYYLFDDVNVEGDAGMATLTIEPGVMVYFSGKADLIVGSDLNGNGGVTGLLMAKGATFTSHNLYDPAPGSWPGITIDSLASDDTEISRCTIEYAINGLNVVNEHANIEINTFDNNLESHILCNGGSPSIMYNDFLSSKRGVHVILEGNPVINYNNIIGGTINGVHNTSLTNVVNAENNWWGDADGPGGNGPGEGTTVSVNVDFDPWLGSVFVPEFPPMDFSLLSPSNGAEFNAGGIVFDWEDAIDEDPGDEVTYTLMVSSSSRFNAASTTEITGLTASTYTWNDNYILNTPVYWKVKAVDTNTEGTMSTETFTLTINVLPPAEFSLLSPADGDSTQEADVEFTWEATTNSALGGALTYTLYIADNVEFNNAETISDLTTTSYTKSGLALDTQYYWKVMAMDENSDGRESSETFMLYVQDPTGVEDESEAVPTVFSLDQNYPNPFNPVTTIRYGLPATSHVTVTLHNALGQEIMTLVDGVQGAGYHSVVWNASAFGSGVYFYRIQAGDFHSIKKAVLTK